jgi:hypothetical protein
MGPASASCRVSVAPELPRTGSGPRIRDLGPSAKRSRYGTARVVLCFEDRAKLVVAPIFERR